jgi:hypothetical protein
MGRVHPVQRDRARMTDRITCPECDGTKGEQLGHLFLACQFCGGLGWVGGPNEPAQRGEAPPPEPSPVWAHPAMAGTGLCLYCMGAREVIHVAGGVGDPVRRGPCPVCVPL